MANHLNLPKILDVPQKLLPLIERFNDFRYFLIHGGRGGGKSQTIARLVLYLCEKYGLRAVCGRETQNSINESVYSILTDLIYQHSLNYEIQAQRISHQETGSMIMFRGFREQGMFNIQGMEGIDLLWIDESQAITKQTLDVIIPTIRKEKAKIIFSMNRHVYNDPVWEFMKDRPDCLTIHINYDENEYCTNALKTEALLCKKRNEKDYNHIWLGEPLDQSEDALYSLEEILRCKNNPHGLREGYGLRVGGFDIARYGDDKTAVVVLQQMGALHWEEVFVDQWDRQDLNFTTGRILQICNEQRIDLAAVDEDGLGAGPFDSLTKGRGLDYFVGFRNPSISYQDNSSFVNPRTLNAYKAKDMFVNGHLCVKDRQVIDELMTIRYTFDHNQRRILVSKEKMRKDGFKSPNLADALIMAVSLIGQVHLNQSRQYEKRIIPVTRDQSLFQIAGVR